MRRPNLSFLCETRRGSYRSSPGPDLLDEVYVRLDEKERNASRCGVLVVHGRVPRPVLYLIYESPSTAEFDVRKEARIHSYVCRVTQFEINSTTRGMWHLLRNLNAAAFLDIGREYANNNLSRMLSKNFRSTLRESEKILINLKICTTATLFSVLWEFASFFLQINFRLP